MTKRTMYQSIPSTNMPTSPGVLNPLSARVPGFLPSELPGGFPGVWHIISSISSTKLSVVAALRHFFSLKLIHQLLKLSNEEICFKTGGMLQYDEVILLFKPDGITKE